MTSIPLKLLHRLINLSIIKSMIITPEQFMVIIAIIFGLSIGSFLNVCVYRLPKKISLWGRSFCPLCKTAIPFYRNIPALTFLTQRGRSACCRQKINSRYFLVEVLTGMLSVQTLYHSLNYTQPLLAYFLWFLLFICPLLVISFIDLELKIIPDELSLSGIILGIIVNIITHDGSVINSLQSSLLGILVGGGILWILAEVISRLKKQDALGGGDIKLIAMLGSFLGVKALLVVFLFSSFVGLFYAVLLILTKKMDEDNTIPFGPFLAFGGMIAYFYGERLTDWYFLQLMHFPFNPLYGS